jgi:hypothetical protein
MKSPALGFGVLRWLPWHWTAPLDLPETVGVEFHGRRRPKSARSVAPGPGRRRRDPCQRVLRRSDLELGVSGSVPEG